MALIEKVYRRVTKVVLIINPVQRVCLELQLHWLLQPEHHSCLVQRGKKNPKALAGPTLWSSMTVSRCS